MSESSKRDGEPPGEGFFDESSPEMEPEIEPSRPPRRESSLFARSPLFSLVALAACGWLLVDMWPDVAYFFSSRTPIDLGGPTVFQLDRAVPNRYCRIAGGKVTWQSFTREQRWITGFRIEHRQGIGLVGANVIVDRADNADPVVIYEGRLLPESEMAEYAPLVAKLREGGFSDQKGLRVLREGDRPGTRWRWPILSFVLATIAAINLRALLRRVFLRK
jgi:hypothetical protein